MNLDTQIKLKIKEMQQLHQAVNSIIGLHEMKPGDKLHYMTTQEVLEAGELRIMEDIAELEFNVLLMQKDSAKDYKPQTYKNVIDMKKKELEEHRGLQRRENCEPTSFRFRPDD